MVYRTNITFITRIIATLSALFMIFPHVAVFAITAQVEAPSNISSTDTEADVAIVLIEEPITFFDLKYTRSFDKNITLENLELASECITILNEAIASNEYSGTACNIMQTELSRIELIKDNFASDLELWRAWEAEYYYATKVFEFLIANGYSREVACAIIGNMMVETGGNTLKLVPDLYDAATGQYYGLCQWSLHWRPEADNLTFDSQLDYLMLDIKKEIDTFGFCYEASFDYDTFCSMTDPQEAAVAFAMTYERCASWSYVKRYKAAAVAYAYFA